MGYGLKRLLEIEEERKRKKEERERIRKEKEAEKKRLKKLEHKKKLKSKQNKRAYKKRRDVELKRRKELGDEYAYYSVYITKNRKRVRYVGAAWWKTDAYRIYTDAIEKNRANIGFKKTVFTNKGKETPVKYEILLVKKTKEGEETVASIRNEMGKFTDNIIVDMQEHVIVDKDEWFVEEKFGVYGFHPYKDKKTYNFILNNIILNNEDVGDEMRRIMVYKNKLIIQYIEDFDFITCYNEEQCILLYDQLEKDVSKLKRKYIVFMGKVAKPLKTSWIDKFEDKTGWNRNKLFHKTTRN